MDRSTAEGMLLSVHCWSGAETCDIFLSTMTIWLLMSLISISEGIMLILIYSCPIFFCKSCPNLGLVAEWGELEVTDVHLQYEISNC